MMCIIQNNEKDINIISQVDITRYPTLSYTTMVAACLGGELGGLSRTRGSLSWDGVVGDDFGWNGEDGLENDGSEDSNRSGSVLAVLLLGSDTGKSDPKTMGSG